MAQKVSWQEPDDTTVLNVEISRATSKFGSYSVIDTIDATSDTNPKDSTNTWVITYTDSTGARTHWYKIRFYDGTNYSEFSEPSTMESLLRLATVDEIKEKLNTVGRWTNDEIFDAISAVDTLVYIDYGTPLQAIWSHIGKIGETVQRKYYVGEENIYRVDRVYYGTATKFSLYLDDGFKMNPEHGMISILPVASGGVTPNTDNDIEIHYVPNIFHELSIYRTCKRLLEQLDFTSGGETSKELQVINDRVMEIETILANKYCLQVSSSVQYYDGNYGVNRRFLRQDHYRNLYIASTGW